MSLIHHADGFRWPCGCVSPSGGPEVINNPPADGDNEFNLLRSAAVLVTDANGQRLVINANMPVAQVFFLFYYLYPFIVGYIYQCLK